MDCLVRLFHGGEVKENGEFENMEELVEVFEVGPTWQEFVCFASRKLCYRVEEMNFRGRIDCGKARSHYVLLKIDSEDSWNKYRRMVEKSNVLCLEVVVETVVPRVETGFVGQGGTQESTLSQLGLVDRAEQFGIAIANDHFPDDTFERDEAYDDEDELSEGSEEGSESEGDDETESEEDVHEEAPFQDLGPQPNYYEPPEYPYQAPEHSSSHLQHGVPGPSQFGGTMDYSDAELRLLRQCHVEIPEFPNDRDLSLIGRALSQSSLVHCEGLLYSEEPEVKKGMKFGSFEELKFFLADYAVRLHRPFTVVHSNRNERYEILCKQGCMWRVWCRRGRRTEQWKITRVVGPHTCRSALPKQAHPQCTATYLGRRILSIVRRDSETSIPSIMEAIFAFTSYRVSYSKAWRAKQYAVSLLWGDWKQSYAMVPRHLSAMSFYNPGVVWCIQSPDRVIHEGGVWKPILQRVFWCFPECAVAFQHCRPVILVDGTFLTGKYKGTLMMAVAVDPEQQLVPLAFALAESENNDSWSWFMALVRMHVLGPCRQVCMISDRHAGLLNCANERMEGYPDLVHRWCMRHFAANMWRRQKKKEVIRKLKVLCMVHTEAEFEEKLHDLKKDLNDEAKQWLMDEMDDKEKWAQAFDVGGVRDRTDIGSINRLPTEPRRTRRAPDPFSPPDQRRPRR
ncbi:unnamed protein product [Urochloa humidicola]